MQLYKLTHEARRVIGVGADLAVHSDQALHHDFCYLAVGQGVLQSVTKEDNKWEGFPEFVRSGGWTRGINTPQFVQHPCFRRIETLQMLLRTSSLETNFISIVNTKPIANYIFNPKYIGLSLCVDALYYWVRLPFMFYFKYTAIFHANTITASIALNIRFGK